MNVYLTGFMGTGKTSVGRALARRLRRPFVDLDADIARRSGRTIAELFARGEARFRGLESAALRRLARRDGLVAALGGGALLRPENLRLARATGVVVCLTCSEPVLWSRLRRGSARPLLGPEPGRRARMRRLLASRRGLYGKVDARVSTSAGSAARAAARIASLL